MDSNDDDRYAKADKSNSIKLGLRPNLRQFLILILVNAFVGAMIGLEQTVVPLIGKNEFGIESNAIIVSFIASFGAVKAILNLYAGSLSDKWGRKNVLVLGWLLGLPVPLILLFASNWNWIIFANVLLGINQGLAWSMTVNMKIDLVGKERWGLALGLNESAAQYEKVRLATEKDKQAYEIHNLQIEQNKKQQELGKQHNNKVVEELAYKQSCNSVSNETNYRVSRLKNATGVENDDLQMTLNYFQIKDKECKAWKPSTNLTTVPVPAVENIQFIPDPLVNYAP